MQIGNFINYLIYQMSTKNQSQKVQIRRNKLRALNDFQKLLADINGLRSTIKLITQKPSNLFQTIQGDKDLNSPRRLSAEAEKEFTLVETKLQDAHIECLNPKMLVL